MEIAKDTDGYTGAELESLVQKTVQYVLGTQINFNNIVESAKKIDNVVITPENFTECLQYITPVFKNANHIKTELGTKIKKVLTNIDRTLILTIVEHIQSKMYPIVCCIEGMAKSGKTSIVCDIGMKIGLDHIEYISAGTLANMTIKAKIDHLAQVFNAVKPTLIILDNIEMIIEFVSETIFDRNILHYIKVLLNETKHHVIITTSYYYRLSKMTILDSVTHHEKIESN